MGSVIPVWTSSLNPASEAVTSPHSALSSFQDGVREDAASGGGGPQNMDRLVELLDSMRSNSSGVEQRLASFMEEAQSSARSEESLAQVVGAIYSTAVADRSFATTAARLCEKMALFMVEGTKFRSLLLNLLQVSRGDDPLGRKLLSIAAKKFLFWISGRFFILCENCPTPAGNLWSLHSVLVFYPLECQQLT